MKEEPKTFLKTRFSNADAFENTKYAGLIFQAVQEIKELAVRMGGAITVDGQLVFTGDDSKIDLSLTLNIPLLREYFSQSGTGDHNNTP